MSWICPSCTFKNHIDINFCEVCHFKRHTQQPGTINEWGCKNGVWNGFVMPNKGGQKIFVDGRDFNGKLFNGDSILFSITQGVKGLKAANIKIQYTPLQSGTIIEWQRDNYWFGFVESDNGQRIFVDGRDFNGKLFKGDRITFKVINATSGAKAIDIVKQNRVYQLQHQYEPQSITISIWNILSFLRHFINFILVAGVLISAVGITTVTLGLNALFWSLPVILVVWCCVQNLKYIKETWDWKSFFILITFVLSVINIVWLVDHEKRIKNLEYLPATIKNIDDRLSNLTNKLDNDWYTPLIEKDTAVKTIDDIVVGTLDRMGISRARLKMGCFMEGSRIQVAEYGESVNVEELRNGDYVFNPILNEQVEIMWIYGYETGYMYEITTNDLLSVNVTRTHAMKMCSKDKDDLFDCQYNIAAKYISTGNWTLTNNGYQQIISIKIFSVQNVMVYNLWLNDMDNIPIADRAVIANGIYTLDFSAQKVHEKNQ